MSLIQTHTHMLERLSYRKAKRSLTINENKENKKFTFRYGMQREKDDEKQNKSQMGLICSVKKIATLSNLQAKKAQ